jgi:predicted DNA binding CopG/RHH family protein
MRAEYDFSKIKGRRNPYAGRLKKPVTMRLGSDVVEYFKDMAVKMDVPYQKLINMYLRDCVLCHRKIEWVSR